MVALGGPVSVALANIFMTEMENEIVSPAVPTFYKRYVDDIYVRRTKDANDNLFDSLNNYHDNIKFTIDEHPKLGVHRSIKSFTHFLSVLFS